MPPLLPLEELLELLELLDPLELEPPPLLEPIDPFELLELEDVGWSGGTVHAATERTVARPSKIVMLIVRWFFMVLLEHGATRAPKARSRTKRPFSRHFVLRRADRALES
jgi:hypothetical protein